MVAAIETGQVVAASNAWIWYPDDARLVETDDYLLIRYPDHFASPFQVVRTHCVRPVDEVIDEVLAHVADDDRTEVEWWVKLDREPDDLAEALARRGGRVGESLDVLAAPLGPARPGPEVPSDVGIRWVTGRDTRRDAERVAVEVFGGEMPPEARLEEQANGAVERLAAGNGTVIAYLDDRPVGTGGVHVVDGVARLWNGSTLAEFRGRGVYRALLGTRLRFAVERGAHMALVKGRIETSSPILRRAGFTAYGQERSIVLPVT